jgi:hypothetical protein
VIDVIFSGAGPLGFEMITGCGPLVVPACWLPNDRLSGLSKAIGAGITVRRKIDRGGIR